MPKPLTVPLSALIPLGMALAGAAMTYVFATKAEVANAAQDLSTRATVLEETVKHNYDTVEDLKVDVKTIDENVRALMIQQGVAPSQIHGGKK